MASFKSAAATGGKKSILNLRLKNPFEIGLRMIMITSRYEEVLLRFDDEPNCQLTVLPRFTHHASYISKCSQNRIAFRRSPSLTLQARHFVYFCAVFSVVPGCAVASLAVSSAVLGPAGTTQSAFLFASYTLSALLVATPITQRWGPKWSMTAGMALLCLYVASFVLASASLGQDPEAEVLEHRSHRFVAGILCAGAVLGGIGAGVLWTAAGVHLARAASAIASSDPRCGGQHQAVTVIVGDDTLESNGESAPASVSSRANRMAGWFAFVFLFEETLLEGLSTVLVRRFLWRWTAVFGFYASLAVTATCLMRWVRDYKPESVESSGNGGTDEPVNGRRTAHTPVAHSSLTLVRKACDKPTLALRQLVTDRKAKYLAGLPLAFGVTGGFFISYVSGQVVPVSLHAPETPLIGSVNGAMAESLDVGGEIGASEAWVGALTAIHGLVAAVSSLLLGYCVNQEHRPIDYSSEMDPSGSNGDHRGVLGRRSVSVKSIAVLVGGCTILAGTGLAFLMWPEPEQWNLASLVVLYALHGVARAAYEGTVKAVHANLYGSSSSSSSSSSHSSATEGAFALVVLFHGIGSVTSYVMAIRWRCVTQDLGCVEYRDGSRHNVRGFAWTVVLISVGAAVGYVRAWFLIQLNKTPIEIGPWIPKTATNRQSRRFGGVCAPTKP
jgi:hypothetical protein